MPAYFYIIDDIKHVPPGYTSTRLSPKQAEEVLRGKDLLFWYIEDEQGEKRDAYMQLRLLVMNSQRGIGFGLDEFLKQCRETDPERLRVGGPHTYLLLRSNEDPELFTPAA